MGPYFNEEKRCLVFNIITGIRVDLTLEHFFLPCRTFFPKKCFLTQTTFISEAL